MSNPTVVSTLAAVESATDSLVSPGSLESPGGYSGRTFKNWAEAQDNFNRMFCYVRTPGVVVRLGDLEMFNTGPFVDHHYSNWRLEQSVENGQGEAKTQRVPFARRWLDSSERNECERMTYAPGSARMYKGALNRWRGMGSESRQGDVMPWNELLDFLFPDAPEQRRYLEQWLAYPLQHLGAKLKTAVVLYSRVNGVGKNILVESVEKIYGSNAVEIGEKQLYGEFNVWQRDKQFVVGDEVQGGRDKAKVIEQLKMLITSPLVEINEKNKPQYSIPNCANFIFLSNNPEPFYISDEDRRFWAWEIPQEKPLSDAFYRKFHDWKESKAGIEALYWHLLHVDTKDFNPDAKAPMTQAKEQMIETGRSAVERWLRDLPYDNPSKYLYTSAELESSWLAGNPHSKSGESAILRALSKLGYKQAYRGKQLKVRGKSVRLWVIAQPEQAERLLAIDEPSELASLYEDRVPAFRLGDSITVTAVTGNTSLLEIPK